MRNESTRDLPATAAAGWRVRHDAGLTAAEQSAFDAWLGADPRNAAAWNDVGATLAALDRARKTAGAGALVRELAGRRRRRWRRRGTLAAAAGLGAAVALAIMFRPHTRTASSPGVPAPAVVTGSSVASAPLITRSEVRTLPDGSRVELAPGAILTVDYTAAMRRVRLLRGEGFFSVEKDTARPFVVETDAVEARAVGTRFAVQRRAKTITVLVTEGTVAVKVTAPADAPTATAADLVLVGAGKELTLPAHSPPLHPLQAVGLSPEEIARQMDWRQPRLQLADTPLRDAVAALNRVNSRQIVLADPQLADLRLTGSYRAEDAPGFARLLETNFAIRVHDRSDGTMELHRK